MAISISGVDKLINKFNKISKLDTKTIIEDVGKELEVKIRSEAQKFSQVEYKCIAVAEGRSYGMSYFLDVGLKNDKIPFEQWKGLYFHNYGYWNHGLNFNGERYINMHSMWFDGAVKGSEKIIKEKIKRKVKEGFKAFNSM